MTIEDLVKMAKKIHDAEDWDLGASSSRETRNAFWARVIGCAYHGHPAYNPVPDRQWHLKRADMGRPQTDDVATSMPSRHHWDCIPGAGGNGYRFAVTFHGALPNDQIVYAPPVPDGSGTIPKPEPVPEPPPTSKILHKGEAFAALKALDQFYRAPEGLKRPDGIGGDMEAIAQWFYQLVIEGVPLEAVFAQIRNSQEWKDKH